MAWMCSSSTWPLPSALSRKPPALTLMLLFRVLIQASLPALTHSSGHFQAVQPKPTRGPE